jgi:hypothetical protein
MLIDTLRLENDRRLVSILLGLMLLPLLWSTGLDLVVYASESRPLEAGPLTARAFCLAVPVVGLLLVRVARTHMAYARAVLAISLTLAATLLLLNLQQPFGMARQMPTTLMFLIAMYAGMPNTFYRQIAAPLFFTAGVILQRFFWPTGTAGELINELLILAFVNLAGVAVVYRRRVLEREVSALLGSEHVARAHAERALTELKTLRGIIRICSYCRKIHNEVGAWQQIEGYVRDHSHAEFSHGICPECVTEYFPRALSVD